MLRRRRELEAVQLQKASAWVVEYEPVLKEAASYGFDVKDAQAKLAIAKTALVNRDPVNASKYGRYIKDTLHRIEKELDNRRLELGTIKHIEGSKCEKCRQESMYEYPDASRKCLTCGDIIKAPRAMPTSVAQSPSAAPSTPSAGPAPAQPAQDAAVTAPGAKKRRLLRW